jgi:hypothetical protein
VEVATRHSDRINGSGGHSAWCIVSKSVFAHLRYTARFIFVCTRSWVRLCPCFCGSEVSLKFIYLFLQNPLPEFPHWNGFPARLSDFISLCGWSIECPPPLRGVWVRDWRETVMIIESGCDYKYPGLSLQLFGAFFIYAIEVICSLARTPSSSWPWTQLSPNY